VAECTRHPKHKTQHQFVQFMYSCISMALKTNVLPVWKVIKFSLKHTLRLSLSHFVSLIVTSRWTFALSFLSCNNLNWRLYPNIGFNVLNRGVSTASWQWWNNNKLTSVC
jgi:hypothetical protein